MESHAQLDPPRSAALGQLAFSLFLLLVPFQAAFSQTPGSASDRITQLKQLYDQNRWSDILAALPEKDVTSADLELYRGLALAKLQRWAEAQSAFQEGAAHYSRDPRFPEELAGIAYRQKRLPYAAKHLRRALALNPQDEYANNFLASIYFLQGNLEGALKYWNRTGQPKLGDLDFEPHPRLNPLLVDRALLFSPGAMWARDTFLKTSAQLSALDLFSQPRFDLQAHKDQIFDLNVYAPERTSWNGLNWRDDLIVARGLPFETVYPEFYDLGRNGENWRSLVRWDDQKRRVWSAFESPLGDNPAIRYQLFFDWRMENWNLTNTLARATPSPFVITLDKQVAGGEILFIPSGLWKWSTGFEVSRRTFRNFPTVSAAVAPFFTNGTGLSVHSDFERWLVRFPERRFTVDSKLGGELGTFFTRPLGRYARAQAGLFAVWFPRPTGDDYEIQASARAGKTFGTVPFDELFTLGFDRDTDLWLRGHPNLNSLGQKGTAPLGRNYVLVNSELDKNIFRSELVRITVGPVLDTGRIYDPSGYFGARTWLWDTGVQAKIGVVGRFEFLLGYGKDLRTGLNSFFTTVTR